MDSHKNKSMGYNMVTQLIGRLEENNHFDYEPGEIIKELFTENTVCDIKFTERMSNTPEFNGNQLFSKMRKSIYDLNKNK
jgi:hypothetical protein